MVHGDALQTSDLYFIYNPASGQIKIGVAANPVRRLEALRTAAGADLSLLGVQIDGAKYERALHHAFRPDRRIGEWFVDSADLRELIAALSVRAIEALLDERASPPDWRRLVDRQLSAAYRERIARKGRMDDAIAKLTAEQEAHERRTVFVPPVRRT